MLRTIMIGNTVQVQGIAVGMAPNGKLMVKVDDKIYIGQAVPRLSVANA
jgi:hypothetical protein